MGAIDVEIQKTSNSRVFLIDGSAGPNNRPQYMSLGRASALSQSLGELEPVRIPSPDSYEDFVTIDTIQGMADLPGLSVEFRKRRAISAVRKLAEKRCDLDVQVHVGQCKTPTDFDRGYDIVGILERSRASNYSTGELGTFDADANEPVIETVDFNGLKYYEVAPVVASEIADTLITDEVIRTVICDAVTCANCGLPSDGAQVAFTLQPESSGSPGVQGKIIFTTNGGGTSSSSIVTSSSIGEVLVDLMCQGPYLVVLSSDSGRIHYALISEVIAGNAIWKTQSTGFVGAGSPLRFIKYDVENTIIVGEAGYIYKMEDASRAVTVLSDGSITVNNLTCGHTRNGEDVVVGGASNTLLYSANGGKAFSALTGPAAKSGVAVTAVYVAGRSTFFVGYADGTLYYTIDGGNNWTQKNIVTLAKIYDIQSSTHSVIWIAARSTLNKGTILRSINGGYSFVDIKETNGGALFPDCFAITTIGVTAAEPNVIFAGGLNTNLADGILVKAS